MSVAAGSVAVAVAAAVAALAWTRWSRLRREATIRGHVLPRGLFDALRKRHPHLTHKDCQLVAQGMRQFFLTHLKSGRRHVSMPSKVADDLWHEFILYTRGYGRFCDEAFGRFLHHTPAAVLQGGVSTSNEGLRRCWRHACMDENIDPRKPTRLPLLFALDKKLGIADGYDYVADCEPLRKRDGSATVHCGGDFSSDAFDGGTDGLNDGGIGADGDAGGGGDGGGGGCGGD